MKAWQPCCCTTQWGQTRWLPSQTSSSGRHSPVHWACSRQSPVHWACNRHSPVHWVCRQSISCILGMQDDSLLSLGMQQAISCSLDMQLAISFSLDMQQSPLVCSCRRQSPIRLVSRPPLWSSHSSCPSSSRLSTEHCRLLFLNFNLSSAKHSILAPS